MSVDIQNKSVQAETATHVLQASAIHKTFQIEDVPIHVLTDVSLQIKTAECVAIMGKSGSGKSTLLSILAGLDSPDSGTVVINDEDITLMNEDQLANKRQNDIGFVFQSFHLIPSLTVAENIAFPLQIRRQANPELVNELISKVDLQHRAGSFPHQLSGGEKQRTAIARALITQPKILFADEPTGNLDEANAAIVMKLLGELQQAFETALVIVTHDPEIAEQADRTIQLVDGSVFRKDV